MRDHGQLSHVSKKNLPSYLLEFQFTFNNRKNPTFSGKR